MGYRIEYGDQSVVWNSKHIRWGRVVLYSCFCFGILCLVTAWLSPQGREVLSQWFYPGDPDVTKQALQHMVLRLREGDTLGEAVMVFCRDVLNETAHPH